MDGGKNIDGKNEISMASSALTESELNPAMPNADGIMSALHEEGHEHRELTELGQSLDSASNVMQSELFEAAQTEQSHIYAFEGCASRSQTQNASSMCNLCGKVALITGANCELGRECASLFVRLGAYVVLSDRLEEGLRKTANKIASGKRNVLSCAANISVQEDVEELVDFVSLRFRRLDILVNIMELPREGTLLGTPPAELKRSIDYGIRPICLLLHMFSSLIVARKGSIVNVISSHSTSGPQPTFAHRVVRSAIDEVIRSASMEFFSEHVRINSVIVNEMSIVPSYEMDESSVSNDNALCTHVERAINAITFLVSDSGAGVTGISISVDRSNDHPHIQDQRQSIATECNTSTSSNSVHSFGINQFVNVRQSKMSIGSPHLFRKVVPSILMRSRLIKQPLSHNISSSGHSSIGICMKNITGRKATSLYRGLHKIEVEEELEDPLGSFVRQQSPTANGSTSKGANLYSLRSSTLRSAGRAKYLLSAVEHQPRRSLLKLATAKKRVGTADETLGALRLSTTKNKGNDGQASSGRGKILSAKKGKVQQNVAEELNVTDGIDMDVVDTINEHESSSEDFNILEEETSLEEEWSVVEPPPPIRDDEMLARIAKVTSAHVYTCSFIHLRRDVPLQLLASSHITNDVALVNRCVPLIHLNGDNGLLRMSFIVDTTDLLPSDLGEDGLGSWNSKEGHRSTTRKGFYDSQLRSCGCNVSVQYEYCLVWHRFVHSYCVPPFSVKKLIWQLKKRNGSKLRYALITYAIREGAKIVVNVPVKRRRMPRQPHETSQQDPPDEQMLNEAIGRITRSPIFKRSYINVISDINPNILLQQQISNNIVCKEVPEIDLTQIPPNATLRLSFIIDTDYVSPFSLNTDSLGVWNTVGEGSRRMNIRKFFFSYQSGRCLEGEHDFILFRRYYLHPDSTPEGIVRKTVWLIAIEGVYSKYALLSYEIRPNADILAGTHKKRVNRLTNKKKSRELPDVRKRLQLMELMESTRKSTHDAVGEQHGELGGQCSYESLMHEMSQRSLRCFTQPYHNDEPFTLMLLSEVFVGHTCCASCTMELGAFTHPSEDLVLEHIERFWNQRTEAYSTQQMQKKYIHARIDCVLSRYPYFTTVDFLHIPTEMRNKLNESHLQYLTDEFGCIFE